MSFIAYKSCHTKSSARRGNIVCRLKVEATCLMRDREAGSRIGQRKIPDGYEVCGMCKAPRPNHFCTMSPFDNEAVKLPSVYGFV